MMPGQHFLVADDDREMRAWLREALAPRGIHVSEAASGWELLTLLAQGAPCDLVVTDLRMPMPSGLHVVAMARSAGLEVPFIVITAFGDPGLRRDVENLGGAALLDKPFTVDELLAQAARLLAKE